MNKPRRLEYDMPNTCTPDQELKALSLVYEALRNLPEDARTRVMNWAQARINWEESEALEQSMAAAEH